MDDSDVFRMDALQEELEQANARITTLENQLTAEREAVRVLGEEGKRQRYFFNVWKHEHANPDSKGRCECHSFAWCGKCATCLINEAMQNTDANPIASAAITDAAKAREGA